MACCQTRFACRRRRALGIIEMKFVALIVSLISLSESGVFCWIGAIYLDTADSKWIVLVTGCLLLLYGVISGLALIIAWMRSIRFLRPLSIWAAAIVLTLWIAGSMDYGMISGHELLGIILLGCMLLFNVLGVCLALKLHDRTQQGSAPDAD